MNGKIKIIQRKIVIPCFASILFIKQVRRHSIKYIPMNIKRKNVTLKYLYQYCLWKTFSVLRESRCSLLAVAWLTYTSTLKMEAIFPSETSVNFSELHGVTSQIILFFIIIICERHKSK
jgi:hypothetical protein